MRLPNKISKEYTKVLHDIMKKFGIVSPIPVYVTDTVRGRCYVGINLTVPLWAMKDAREGYRVYYVCHEIAHTMVPDVKGDQHGPAFQKAFMSICPKKYQHFELGYKPKLAAAAGIRKPV